MTHPPLTRAFPRIRQFDLAQRGEFSISESLRRANRLVSDRVGIVAKLEFQYMQSNEPKVYWAHASPPNFYQGSPIHLEHHGFGISALPERAIIKAVGECIERYCAFPPDHRELVFGNPASARAICNAVEPEQFALFSPAQYADPALPFDRPDSQRALHWTQGISLRSGEPMLVPASFVYIPYGPQYTAYPPEPRLAKPISTGLACGPTYSAAVYRGLLEVVERDAFMLSWRYERSMPTLDTTAFQGTLTRALLHAIDELPVQLVVKLATVDIGVSVVLVMLTAKTPSYPLFAMGAGADFDTEHALVQALEEALLCHIGLGRVESPQEVDEAAELARGVNSVAMNGLAHARDASLQALRRCLVEPSSQASGQSIAPRQGNLGDLVDELGDKGYDSIAVDLTPPDVDAAGFKVVRVLVPGLQPLDVDRHWPYLGTERSKTAFQTLGGGQAPRPGPAIPRMPHPFS